MDIAEKKDVVHGECLFMCWNKHLIQLVSPLMSYLETWAGSRQCGSTAAREVSPKSPLKE